MASGEAIMTVRMCVECEDTEAALRCGACQDDYCVLCFGAQHRSGSRAKHQYTILPGATEQLAVAAPLPPPKPTSATASAESSSPASVLPPPPAAAVPVAITVPVAVPAPHEATSSSEDSDDDDGSDEEMDGDDENDEDDEDVRVGDKDNAILRDAAVIPLRLTENERALLNLLDASLNVSEYTDKVDVLSYRSPVRRMLSELCGTFSTLSGMLCATDFRQGKRLVHNQKFEDNDEFFRQVFEIGRRYKIMNPERMRNNYGKMIYLLQDASMRDIEQSVGFSCVAPIRTVASFLKQRHALDLLRDSRCAIATSVSLDRSDSNSESLTKQQAIEQLASEYATSNITSDEIRLALSSISDAQSYVASNRSPITQMIALLQQFFTLDKTPSDRTFSLEIRAGKNGARLSHSHATQYEYVLQSLLLWENITASMLRLWWAVESDLLGGNSYRLRDTGQGLNRVQHAPQTANLVHSILSRTQRMRPRWVGSSVVHLGDHNVPNALLFIDKYTQVSRILSPIVNTVQAVDALAQQPNTRVYINESFGGPEQLKRTILCDFFKHGFDGSGADNFFDAGSCIDGRLTSAWNWCSKIERKSFFHVFLMAGFVGFDGQFDK